ncbi:microsomal signal peptidase subunit [Coleophoma crateriformis]|uniref:Signal peptidase complex subunit 2 n=1 Tax=Coleophoma crateriformis TaxID=565419 RepID=A0A3D8QES1_9HELO|nr:microsomal signal peptidase subunit [Coleophoma crateriformis]
MAAPEKISVYSLNDLKNTSDDAIPAYLNSLKFKQSHTLSDVRLALGYSAFLICAACFYWDYKFGFESTKIYTTIAVALYTIINSALTLWIWGVEKGIIYVGTTPNGEKIEITTSVKKHVPVYNIVVKTTSKSGKTKEIKFKREFRKWFDAKGNMVAQPFQQLWASNVECIGMVDQKNIVRTKEEGKKTIEVAGKDASMDEKWASLLAESQPGVTGVETESGTASKRGKGKK